MFVLSIEKTISYVKSDDVEFKREYDDGEVRWFVKSYDSYQVISDNLKAYHKLEEEYNSMGCV